MKNKVLVAGILCFLFQGCFSLTDKQEIALPALPDLTTEQIASSLSDKKPSKKQNDFPQTLGGLVHSDSWIIYQEKQEEELKGNVSYENDQYRFRADYALSQRAKNLVTAIGNVYIRKQDPDHTWYEVYADKVVYNYKTGKGYALTTSRPVRLFYHTAKEDLIEARAHRVDFNTQEQTAQLTGSATLIHTDLKGQKNTLKAKQISVRQKDQYALLQGNAEIFNEQYTLKADRMEYKGLLHQALASGNRPLASGTTENGTFAIIADEVSADTLSRDVHLNGKVQGWILSEQINSAEQKERHL